MLFFIPAYDEATRTNLAVIQSILPKQAVPLLAEQAIKKNLWLHLPNYNTLFVMSHGNSDKIWGNNDETALTIDDKASFKNQSVSF